MALIPMTQTHFERRGSDLMRGVPLAARSLLQGLSLSFILLTLLALWGCEPSVPAQKPLRSNAKILAFGESLIYGKGVLPEESIPARLEAGSGRVVINGGRPGEISAEGVKRLPIWLNEHEPDLLILCHGANDLLRSISEDKVEANIRAMVRMARDRGIDVILIAVPKFGGLNAAPGFFVDVAEEFKIPLEKHVLEEIVGEPRYHKDSVHPNAEGYQRVADALLKLMHASGAL